MMDFVLCIVQRTHRKLILSLPSALADCLVCNSVNNSRVLSFQTILSATHKLTTLRLVTYQPWPNIDREVDNRIYSSGKVTYLIVKIYFRSDPFVEIYYYHWYLIHPFASAAARVINTDKRCYSRACIGLTRPHYYHYAIIFIGIYFSFLLLVFPACLDSSLL